MVAFIDDSEFGIIRVNFRRNNRRIVFRVLPCSSLVISAPIGTPLKSLSQHLDLKRLWVRDALGAITRYGAAKKVFTPQTAFQTRFRKLVLLQSPVDKASVYINTHEIKVVIPNSCDWYSDDIQSVIRLAINKALSIEANSLLPKMLNSLALRHGFVVKGLKIRDMRTRWGSCSSEKRISLNQRLLLLPDHLIEHVLLHELCHTVVMNHSQQFYDLMSRLNPNSKLYDSELKRVSINLF